MTIRRRMMLSRFDSTHFLFPVVVVVIADSVLQQSDCVRADRGQEASAWHLWVTLSSRSVVVALCSVLMSFLIRIIIACWTIFATPSTPSLVPRLAMIRSPEEKKRFDLFVRVSHRPITSSSRKSAARTASMRTTRHETTPIFRCCFF